MKRSLSRARVAAPASRTSVQESDSVRRSRSDPPAHPAWTSDYNRPETTERLPARGQRSPTFARHIRDFPCDVEGGLECFSVNVVPGAPSLPGHPAEPPRGERQVSPPQVDEDELLFYVQRVVDAPERAPPTAAEVFAQIKYDLAPDGSRRVPDGPKPGTGRPKKQYKPVARKVKPLQERLPEEYRIVRTRPPDCMDDMPELPARPPVWEPTTPHLTRERMDGFKLGEDGFIQPEEVKLFQFLIEKHQEVFAWEERERRRFKDSYVPPIRFPVVPHEPWTDRNIPVPHAIRERVIQLIKDKIEAGVYEPSSSAYRSGWFCVVKKDGSSLRIVHDLQRLNSVTIRDAGTLPSPDEFSEMCAGRACIGALDLFSSYDQQLVHPDSRDLTAFQSPAGGAFRIVSLPQGYSNAVAIQQGNVTFILAPEIPEHALTFVDDVTALGPRSYYRGADGSFETIPGNTGIRRFVWEHAGTLNRVLQRLRHAGASISGKKAVICAPKAVVVGYEVSFEGRRPLQDKVQRVLDWPACRNVSDVRAFLGTAGLVRLWTRNFALIARPLTNLTKKDGPFEFTPECHEAMLALKERIANAPCIKPIDYRCGRAVTLAVDSSIMGVGFYLFQVGEDGERNIARFGSIAWNEVEARYSQPKIELYGLWRALRNFRLYIVGLDVLIVEVDAKYIKGMLNHPDMQPNATINRWIAGILLFNIRLVHVPATLHSAADGLSRRVASPDDPVEEDDHEDWLDRHLGLWVATALARAPHSLPRANRLAQLAPDALHRAAEGALIQMPREGPFAGTLAAVLAADTQQSRLPTRPENCLSDGTYVVPPRTDALRRKDEQLDEFERFLRDLQLPETLHVKHRPWFFRQAQKFFIIDDRLMRRDDEKKHKVVIKDPVRRVAILEFAHDDTGHKGVFATDALIRERFWWPGLAEDVRWYCATCDTCQRRQVLKIKLPPTIARVASLFQRIHLDTMWMPASRGKHGIHHARCALSLWAEALAIAKEKAAVLATFLLELQCRFGFIYEIITDNGAPVVAAVNELAARWGIHHIRVSGYNSQANGLVEHKHFDLREVLVKLCDDGDSSHWTDVLPLALWAERVTVRRTTGMSPYYMVHGVEPTMPLDLAEATYLTPPLQPLLSTEDLIVLRARQLQRRDADLELARQRVLAARFKNAEDFMKKHGASIRDFDFKPGELVLIRNTRVEKDLGLKKIDDRYYGPMVVVQRRARGSYTVAELDGSISILRCAAFRVIPYFARSRRVFDIDDILANGRAQLELIDKLQEEEHDVDGPDGVTDSETN